MTTLSTLTDNQLVVLAAQVISDGDLDTLTAIAVERKDTFDSELLYRLLLTFYPPNVTTQCSLIAFLLSSKTSFQDYSPLDKPIDLGSIRKVGERDASRRCSRITLKDLGNSRKDPAVDLLTAFIITWLHEIDITDGTLSEWIPLVERFASISPKFQLWRNTYFTPVMRLQHESYPQSTDLVTLRELERVSGQSGVELLLSPAVRSTNPQNIARDLDHAVRPWIQGCNEAKRRRIDTDGRLPDTKPVATWSDVNEWMFQKSLSNFKQIAETAVQWSGPLDLVLDDSVGTETESTTAYVQTLMAIVYAQSEALEGNLLHSRKLLERAADLAAVQISNTGSTLTTISPVDLLSAHATEMSLSPNMLQSPDNPLTKGDEPSIIFLDAVIRSAEVLKGYRIDLAVPQVARLGLSGSITQHHQELSRILAQVPRLTSTSSDWHVLRSQLLWLRSWTQPSSHQPETVHQPAVLARVSLSTLETDILHSILTSGQYQFVDQIYLDNSAPPLSREIVEKSVVSAIFSAYDNATNGNRTRGGVKKASEMLQIFRTRFPESVSFAEIDHLIRATHSLSFYQLTLQDAVPFRPVDIRVHDDPLDLIAKILDQDMRAYTKLDDLLQIGRHLVQAGVPKDIRRMDDLETPEKRILEADHRITYLAISAALAANDFDTAYSYITSRLSASPFASSAASTLADDTSWRAAYMAGKYRPVNAPKPLHARISDLSKRMDLLSLALTLAPNPESLPEILGTWRRCEEEMESLKSQALDEERAFDSQGDGILPGGFGPDDREVDVADTKKAQARRQLANRGASYEEQGPVGLFEVAKGAASALRKSAFPLSGQRGSGLRIAEDQAEARKMVSNSESLSPTYLSEGRTRKRDLVSNAVKGGLGWVLGVQQTETHEHEDDG